MKRNSRHRIVVALAAITILLGVFSVKSWPTDKAGVDFSVYYTAGCLVRNNLSLHIYDGTDQHSNPQLVAADPKTLYAETAKAHGISSVMLYLYPPLLADLIVPLTVLSPLAALLVWEILNLFMIASVSTALRQMLDMKFIGSFGLISAAVLLFRPTLNSLYWGQITILLTVLLIIGFEFYINGSKRMAALLFALAIAIKLIPIIVIIPLIAWRDWKSLRLLAGWCIAILAFLWIVNGGSALGIYFFHELPVMANGDLGNGDFENNRSLGNFFFKCLAQPRGVLSSIEVVWLVRILSVLALCWSGWLSQPKAGENLTNRQRSEIFIIFLLLACALSPYSWLYAWALSAPAVVMFCKRSWYQRASSVEMIFFVAFLLSLSTSRLNMSMVTPVLAIALGLVGLHNIRSEQQSDVADKVFESPVPVRS